MTFDTQNYYTWYFSRLLLLKMMSAHPVHGSNKRKLKLPSQEVGGAYRDVGKGRAHHEVEDPGLQLDDIGGRKLCPNCGQDEEEDRREEGQKGLVQAVVFQ